MDGAERPSPTTSSDETEATSAAAHACLCPDARRDRLDEESTSPALIRRE